MSRAGAMPLSLVERSPRPDGAHRPGLRAAAAVIAGPDRARRHLEPAPVPDYASRAGPGVAGLRVGVPEGYFFQGVDAEMAAGVRAGGRTCWRELGARVAEIGRCRIRRR